MSSHHSPPSLTMDIHAQDLDGDNDLRDLKQGLTSDPLRLSPRFFYDDYGSKLFELICDQPEYYQTRTEQELLQRIAAEAVSSNQATDLVELGSGAALKTRTLLDAMRESGSLRRYVPFDVNEWIVRRSAAELMKRYPTLAVHGVVGTFGEHLGELPTEGRQLVILLGGTIGNFERPQAVQFIQEVRDGMKNSDRFLLGVDLIKDVKILEAAYNDSKGITAAFNRNILNSVNRVADGDFDPGRFAHRAYYNVERHQIEMWLDSLRDQTVQLSKVPLELSLTKEQGIHTEISVKYDRVKVEALFEDAGLSLESWFEDPEGLFGLALARPR